MTEALLLTDKSFTKKEQQKLNQGAKREGINLTIARKLASVEKDHFDVYVVEDKLTGRVQRRLSPANRLIQLIDEKGDITRAYKKAQELDTFNILSFPIDKKVMYKQIKEAHQALVNQKKSNLNNAKANKALAVTSLKGGVGKSLLSYNLAYQLAKLLPDNQILVIDFSQPLGSAKAILDVESKFSWDTVRPLLKEKKSLSKKRLFGVLNFTQYNFSVLTFPQDFSKNEPLSEDELEILLQSCKNNFTLTLADLPTLSNTDDFNNFKQFDHSLIVLTPEPSSILNTHQAIKYLKKHHPDTYQKSIFVLNKLDTNSALTIDTLEKKLKIKILAKIEEDLEAVNVHLTKASPLEDEELIVTQDFRNMAERIFKTIF